jgi:hypothetical protein
MSIGGDRGIQGALYDSHEIVFITEDMRVVAKGRLCMYGRLGGVLGFDVRVPDLKYIENILHVQFEINPVPILLVGPFWKSITGNVVGMSIYQAGGTTICVDVIAVGPP